LGKKGKTTHPFVLNSRPADGELKKKKENLFVANGADLGGEIVPKASYVKKA